MKKNKKIKILAGIISFCLLYNNNIIVSQVYAEGETSFEQSINEIENNNQENSIDQNTVVEEQENYTTILETNIEQENYTDSEVKSEQEEYTIINNIESYDNLEPKPTEPIVILEDQNISTTETDPSTVVTTEISEETVENQDGSSTITTTTTETTITNSTIIETTTEQYAVESHGEYQTDSKETANHIVQQETKKQEEIKTNIEQNNGQYDYTIETQDNETHTIKTEEELSHDAAIAFANELAESSSDIQDIQIEQTTTPEERQESLEKIENIAKYLDGENITTQMDEDTVFIEATFNSLNQAESFLQAAAAQYGEQNIKNSYIEKQEMQTKQTEEKGYHSELTIDENGDYLIVVTITGGLEEINLAIQDGNNDLMNFEPLPGDTCKYRIQIINQSEDEYEITGYDKNIWGPYKYIRTSRYTEDMGRKVDEMYDGYYTLYEPADIKNLLLGGAADTLQVVRHYCEENNINFYDLRPYEREQLYRNNINDDYVLNYYNTILNSNYTTIYDAWAANLKDNLWDQKYNGIKSEEYFESLKGQTLKELMLNGECHIKGRETDNYYQNTVWLFGETLALKLVEKYKAGTLVEDTKYSVSYDEVSHEYNVKIDGAGEYVVSTTTETPNQIVIINKTQETITIYPEPEEPEDEENTPIPNKPDNPSAPSIKPEPLVVTIPEQEVPLTDMPQQVLGVQREIETPTIISGSVLGVSRTTGDDSIIEISFIVLSMSLVAIVLYVLIKTSSKA